LLEGQDGTETWEAKAEVHVGDPDGDPVEPSPGTARPPPATDGTGEGLPMSPHRSGGKSKAAKGGDICALRKEPGCAEDGRDSMTQKLEMGPWGA